MKRFLTVFAAPLLLLLVATTQLFLANARTLTPWKGGGFGMFSSVDSGGARVVRAWLETPGGPVEIDLPRDTPHQPWVGRRVDNLCAMPSEPALRALADDLLTLEWIEPNRAKPTEPTEPPGPATRPAQPLAERWLRARYPDDPKAGLPTQPVLGVRLELWRVTFDANTDSLRAGRWMSAQTHRGAE